MAAVKKTELVEIRPIEEQKIKITIVGDTPLIMHAWSAKARRQMLETQLGITKRGKRDAKNPWEDFASSLYWLTKMPEEFNRETVTEAIQNGARFGFPVNGIKMAAISAAYRMGWSKDMVSLKSAFFIEATHKGYYSGALEISSDNKSVDIIPNKFISMGMAEIKYESVEMREDTVTVGNGNADIRYRGEFQGWWADLVVKFNGNGNYTKEQILNIVNAGGYGSGLGEWRPEKDGQNGMFHLVTTEE